MTDYHEKKPGFGRVFLGIAIIFVAIFALSKMTPPNSRPSDASSTQGSGVSTETYRLIHAIGSDEKEAARGLSKRGCDSQKVELKAVAEALGTYNEKTGFGSITCLPESTF